MRALAGMDTIQIEITGACHLNCSNCTRLVGHAQKPFYLTEEQLHAAVDSLVDFPNMVGFMGGEPLLHPKFAEFCEYASTKIPRERLGLWSAFPDTPKYRGYAEIICKTFGNIFLNDHTRPDIMHAPILAGIEELVKDPQDLFLIVDNCWVQNGWSAAINPKGAFFCEVAAAMADLFDGPEGWKVEPGWWKRVPKDYKEQIERWCPQCGCGLPLARRASVEDTDDISPKNLERLKAVNSRKVAKGQYVVSEFQMDQELSKQKSLYPNQVYKDLEYRQDIARRYGIYLTFNEKGFMNPNLMKNFQRPEPLFKIFQQKYGNPAVQSEATR